MMIQRDIWFTPTQKTRKLHIWLPDGYEKTQERYPVMYFFDGHNLFCDEHATYGKCWGLRTFMEQWDKPMILVGIECGHEGNERLNEYLPYPVNRGIFKGLEGVGDATVRWMIEELKPMIDRDYRTYPFRECTAIGGSSMGGLMSLYAVIRYNQWYSKAACLSSTIYPCMPLLLKDLDKSPINPDTRVYLSWGTKEARGIKDPEQEDKSSYTYRNNKAVENKLREKGAITRMYCQIGGGHCEADWEKQVPGFMDFLWK